MQATAHRRRGDEARARVLDIALELIAERGFAATSTREISERLGFTKAALYYHFHTKDELLAAIIAPAVAGLAALVEGAGPREDPDARRHLLEGYVDLVASHENLVRVLADDPTARKCSAVVETVPLYDKLLELLSGEPENEDCAERGTEGRTRVRATLGAVHAALLHAGPDDDPATMRATALVAACGALGLQVHP